VFPSRGLPAWVGIAGVILCAGTWVIGEYVAPRLEQYAIQQKTLLRFQEFSSAGSRGAWAKDGDTFISVQQQSAENRFAGIYVFRFDAQRRLQSLAQASTASVGPGNEWVLENYEETAFLPEGIKVTRQPRTILNTRLAPEFLGLASVDPDLLSARELHAYIGHLQSNDLEATRFETAFWARIARTAALLVVVMLAVPVAMGPMRTSGAGARTVVGILLGAGFFLLARMLESGGQVFSLSPLVIAWGPTALMALTAAVAIARTR
jgi:lipopolysaccharide export system permease protein